MFGLRNDEHPRPRRGSKLGRDAETALLLIAEAIRRTGSTEIRLEDIPARQRHYVNSKGPTLEHDLALIRTSPERRGSGRSLYRLTELGRDMVESIQGGAWS